MKKCDTLKRFKIIRRLKPISEISNFDFFCIEFRRKFLVMSNMSPAINFFEFKLKTTKTLKKCDSQKFKNNSMREIYF